jgi:hypothetical protein
VSARSGREKRRHTDRPPVRRPTRRVQDWLALVENSGPFAPLSLLRGHLEQAPPAARTCAEYHWLRGLIQGRELHEEFGGVDVKR